MRSRVAVGPVVAGCVLLAWAGTAPAGAAPEHRAVQPYAASGAPVQGSTTGCDNAPVLTPGRYLDGLLQGKDLWYRVEKRPEQVLDVSATAAPPDLMYGTSNMKIGVGWAEGDDPNAWLSDLGTVHGGRVSVGGRSNQKADGQRSGCIHITNTLSPMGSQAKSIPIEIALRFTDSPQPSTTTDGFSFAGAREVPADGVVKGDLALGEFPFWRVQLKDGQTLTVRTVMQHPASLSAGRLARWTVDIYNPLRSAARCPAKAGDRSEVFVEQGSGTTQLTCGPWKVDTDLKDYESEFTIPGTYYIVPGVLGEIDAGHGQVVPYEMTVTVEGAGTDHDPSAAFTGSSVRPGAGKESAMTAGRNGGAGAATGTGGGTGGKSDAQPGGDPAMAGAADAEDDGGSGTIALTAAAAAAALVSVGAFLMHMRRRRAGAASGSATVVPSGEPFSGSFAAPAAPPAFPAPPAPVTPPAPSIPPPAAAFEEVPGPSAEPDHNAMDSDWSMSAIPAGSGEADADDPDTLDGHDEPEEPAAAEAAPVPPTFADGIVFTPPPGLLDVGTDDGGDSSDSTGSSPAPSWRPPAGPGEPPARP
ncbi:hypothetical protein ACPA54_38740 [Uniformispora flossi]|uniref:hypothetical protein n=1 Tax=Uniformispora flossi TaxID=3390723 RepID=UPI003C304C38